jgi:hypothetical protein
MPHPNPFPVGTLVNVRPKTTQPWRAGEVTAYDNHEWVVALDVPITQLAWLGTANRYKPADTLSDVTVYCAAQTVLPADFIQAQV